MTDRWLIAVGAGRWQMSGIRAAQAERVRVLALDADADALGFAIADMAAVIDIRDAGAAVQSVRDAGIRPSGAAAFVTDAGMAAAAAIREAYALPGPRSEVVVRLTDKASQRRMWTDAGLRCPQWHCVATESQAEESIGRLKDTIILKPPDSAGSRGVTVVEAAEDWRPAFAAARKASRSGRVIIESFIRGIEYTVETFAHRGTSWVLAISEKRKVPGTRETVALELATPALPRDVSTSIGQFACEALAALGYTDGPGHTEILRDKAGALWLVEAAGRGGGFMVADGIVPRASGFDIARATVLQAVGLEPPTPSNAEPVAFALRFLPSTPGVVTGMSGFERANALDNVECGPLVSLGNHVGMPDTDGARLAYILAWANDRETAVERADRAEALLRIEISPCPPRKS